MRAQVRDTARVLRRLVLLLAGYSVLVAPAAAGPAATADGGSLVVKNGAAPWDGPSATGVPVVALRIMGSVIGRVTGSGKVIIDAGIDTHALVHVVGAGRPTQSKKSDTAQVWTGNDFTFRAVGSAPTTTLVVVVYGSHVNLIAAGIGVARLAGMPDGPRIGRYSLNDGDFQRLPVRAARIIIGTSP